jgi:uncharacterized membrane protein
MSMWHVAQGQQQYGPIDEDTLRLWASQGRINPTDLVWCEGWPDWRPASTVPGLVFAAANPQGPPPNLYGNSMVVASLSPGTGGATENAQINTRARSSLAGRWGWTIAFCLLFGLLEMAVQLVPYIGGLAMLILCGPFILGYHIFFLTFIRSGKAELGMMFKGFENFGNALGAYLLQVLFVFLWTLLLIIPGIIASLSYSQTMYLLAEDKTLGPLEAIRQSKKMMQGHKLRLLGLHIRYFGWSLVCILTLGIGLLWLSPYIGTGLAHFYEDLRPPVQTDTAA